MLLISARETKLQRERAHVRKIALTEAFANKRVVRVETPSGKKKKKEKGSIPKGPILSRVRRFIVLLNVLAEIL